MQQVCRYRSLFDFSGRSESAETMLASVKKTLCCRLLFSMEFLFSMDPNPTLFGEIERVQREKGGGGRLSS